MDGSAVPASSAARCTAITAATAASMRRGESLVSLLSRAPRESSRRMAFATWRASRESPSWVRGLVGRPAGRTGQLAANVEPYLRVDGTSIWSLMQLESEAEGLEHAPAPGPCAGPGRWAAHAWVWAGLGGGAVDAVPALAGRGAPAVEVVHVRRCGDHRRSRTDTVSI